MKIKIIVLLFVVFLFNVYGDDNILNYDESFLESSLRMQNNSLIQNERILLNRVKIIIKNPEMAVIGTEVFNDVRLSNICISSSYIQNVEIRFKIAHYFRNLLVPENDQFIFDEYDEFIQNNSNLICEVAYYFYHKDYYGVYRIFPMGSEELIFDKRLGADAENLRERLETENALFLYGR